MSIWQKPMSLAVVNAFGANSLMGHLGIEITDFGDDYLEGTMPVDARTHQPMGLLHGGASVALAETLASIAGSFAVPEGHAVVGMEINANHLAAMRNGLVKGRASPLHIGRSSQVWEIRLTNEAGKLVCISRMTAAVRKISMTG
jgi:1,4-dihydroxy-2-naphthoyl-CoA hydrolase